MIVFKIPSFNSFPEHVSRLILLDCIKPISRPLGLVVKRTRQAVDDLINIEKKLANGSPLAYKHEEAISRHMEGKILIQNSYRVNYFKLFLEEL